VNLKVASLGLLLILVDVSYNIIVKDEFRYFDYGRILAGIFIVLLNINWLSFLKIKKQMVIFSSYFVFFTMVKIISKYTGSRHPLIQKEQMR